MLQNDFFSIIDLDRQEGSCKAVLELNAQHTIFEGHFPGHPVVPGACMMQMVKEIAETFQGRSLQLVRADQIKFLKVVDPGMNRELEMQLAYLAEERTHGKHTAEQGGKPKEEGDAIKVSASLSDKSGICFKFSGLFRVR